MDNFEPPKFLKELLERMGNKERVKQINKNKMWYGEYDKVYGIRLPFISYEKMVLGNRNFIYRLFMRIPKTGHDSEFYKIMLHNSEKKPRFKLLTFLSILVSTLIFLFTITKLIVFVALIPFGGLFILKLGGMVISNIVNHFNQFKFGTKIKVIFTDVIPYFIMVVLWVYGVIHLISLFL